MCPELHQEGNVGSLTQPTVIRFMISKVCADVLNNAQFEVQKDIQLAVFDEAFLQHRDVEQLSAKNGETTMQHKHWLFNDESAS